MRNAYITDYYHAFLAPKELAPPRKRFVRYYDDLFNLEGKQPPELSAYLQSGQYTYVELGDAILKLCRQDLVNTELFVTAYWGHEFDPDKLFGAYFCHKYGIEIESFDVCDQGVLAPIIAIKIIQAYIQSGAIKQAVLVCFDQACIPVGDNFQGVFPSCASAIALVFKAQEISQAIYKVVCADVRQNNTLPVFPDAYNRQIYINSNSIDYSCAEILHAIFKRNPQETTLVVKGSEYPALGVLSLLPVNGGCDAQHN